MPPDWNGRYIFDRVYRRATIWGNNGASRFVWRYYHKRVYGYRRAQSDGNPVAFTHGHTHTDGNPIVHTHEYTRADSNPITHTHEYTRADSNPITHTYEHAYADGNPIAYARSYRHAYCGTISR